MNLSERAESRIYWQYQKAPKLRQWVLTLPEIAQSNLEDPTKIVRDILDIDQSSGEQLNIIGRIVGVKRPTVSVASDEEDITQLATDSDAVQLGDDSAELSDPQELVTGEASDALMRVLIKAKIARNNGNATIDNIIESARFVAGFDDVTVKDNQDMTWSVSFGQQLTEVTRFAFNNFDILPHPHGTEFLGFVESATYTQFGAEFAQFGDSRAQFNEVFI